jgi:hypothetical protein
VGILQYILSLVWSVIKDVKLVLSEQKAPIAGGFRTPMLLTFTALTVRYHNKNKTRTKAGLPGFEPGFEAPEATVLSRLYYRPSVLSAV